MSPGTRPRRIDASKAKATKGAKAARETKQVLAKKTANREEKRTRRRGDGESEEEEDENEREVFDSEGYFVVPEELAINESDQALLRAFEDEKTASLVREQVEQQKGRAQDA